MPFQYKLMNLGSADTHAEALINMQAEEGWDLHLLAYNGMVAKGVFRKMVVKTVALPTETDKFGAKETPASPKKAKSGK